MRAKFLTQFLLLFALIAPRVGSANIDLDLRPDDQIATVGSTVNMALYAVSDNGQNQSIGAMDVILVWDPAKLSLTGFTNAGNGYAWFQSGFLLPGGLNTTYSDGDAQWTAFAQPGAPAFATPSGLKVTTFQFQALSTTPGTVVAIPRTRLGQMTTVFDGFMPNTDVTGNLDAGANVQIFTDIYPITSYTVAPGIVLSGGIPEMQQSDDMYMVVRPGVVISSTQSPIVLIGQTTLPSTTATELTLTVESAMNQGNVNQKLEMYNYMTALYDLVDSMVLPTTDTTVNIVISSNPSRYIDPGTGGVNMRLSCKTSGPILSYPWLLRIDKICWKERT